MNKHLIILTKYFSVFYICDGHYMYTYIFYVYVYITLYVDGIRFYLVQTLKKFSHLKF